MSAQTHGQPPGRCCNLGESTSLSTWQDGTHWPETATPVESVGPEGASTSVWAEAPLLVGVIVAGGGTPELAILPALAGAGAVGLPEEGEGEDTRISLGVATNHRRVCSAASVGLALTPAHPARPRTAPGPLRCPISWGLPTPHSLPPQSPFFAHTSVGAEAILLVLVKVGSGGTPAVAIGAPVRGAGIVGGAIKDEGEDTGGPITVATGGVEDCGVRRGGGWPRAPAGGAGLRPWLPALTLAGAEAVFLVPVVAAGGSAPGQPIRAPLRDAPRVRAALEDEGEVAVSPVGIPVACLHHCLAEEWLSSGAGGGTIGSPQPARPCPYLCQFPASRAHPHQSGHHPECLGQGERHGPRAHPCRRRGTHPHALWGQEHLDLALPEENLAQVQTLSK